MSEETPNVINSTDARRWVSEIERIDEEILSIKMRNAAEVKGAKERKKATFERAEAAGLPLEALKLELFRRDLDRKRKDRESEAGEDHVELADMIREALGDFADSPLGKAAVEAAEDPPAPKRRGRPAGSKNKTKLVGEDTGAPPWTGPDDAAEAERVAEAKERLVRMIELGPEDFTGFN
jgi:hypothetical protein